MKRSLDEHGDDEDYHFFMSLLPHVRKLEPVHKLHLRAKMQDLVCHEVYGRQQANNGHHETAPDQHHPHQLM